MAIVSYKCSNCGGELVFDPKTQKYRCAYCSSLFTEEEMEQLAREYQEQANQSTGTAEDRDVQEEAVSGGADDRKYREDAEASGAVIYSCPSCGAQIVAEETTAATFCYYCHNPVVLGGRLEGKYLPDKVIPFQITEEQAKDAFLKWAGEKKYVPRELFLKKNLEKIAGVYFPYWMMDYEIAGNTVSRAQTVRVWQQGDTQYTETTEYELRRKGTVDLNDCGRNALQSVHQKLLQGVMPFRMEECVPFKMSYLSGFQAEKRNIEREQLQAEVQDDMLHRADWKFKQSEDHFINVRRVQEQFRVKVENWSYALLPVWVLTFARSGQMYYFVMNGQTGEVFGSLPVDKARLRIRSLIWGVAAGVLLAAVLLLMGGV